MYLRIAAAIARDKASGDDKNHNEGSHLQQYRQYAQTTM